MTRQWIEKHGLKWFLDMNEGIDHAVAQGHGWEPNTTRFFNALVVPGGSVLDIGANIGWYTMLAAQRGSRVLAVEPAPAMQEVLRQHVAANAFGGLITLRQVAVSATAQKTLTSGELRVGYSCPRQGPPNYVP